MPETFDIKHHLRLGEYLDAIIYGILRLVWGKKIFVILIVVLFASNSFLLLSSSKRPEWYIIFGQLVVAPLIPVLSLLTFTLLLSIPLYFIKGRFFKNIHYRFTHWGMEKTGKGFEVTIPWRSFTSFKETRSFFLLYVSPGNAQVIQKRMFENKEQAESFKRFVAEHMNKH